MGSMTSPASDSLTVILSRLDARVRKVDEERWLSSRYASAKKRQSLITLYAFYYELARVRISVSDPTLGQIRFQWWRDALAELERGEPRQHDVVIALMAEYEQAPVWMAGLKEIVDQFEAAFLANARDQEPDDLLALTASAVCQPDHVVADEILQIAPEWAKLRRGETVEAPVAGARVSATLRPALAHFRLRHVWTRKKTPDRLQIRLSILMAMIFGRI